MGQSSLTVHDFKEELNYSEKASDELFWFEVYKKAFPNMVNCMPCNGNTQSQRMGIDRAIFLANGKTLYIDEKKRRKTYRDILLEYISSDTTNALGWIEKDLSIDYLAYAFMDTRTVHLYPWNLLRRAWILHREEWIRIYRIPPARNYGYNTLNVAIPPNILKSAITEAITIELDPIRSCIFELRQKYTNISPIQIVLKMKEQGINTTVLQVKGFLES